jgi:hypothetical protein
LKISCVYRSFLLAEKYDIDIPTTVRSNFTLMPKNWNVYLTKLRETDDNLYNQKEQFKVGLLTPSSKLKKEETIKDEADAEKTGGEKSDGEQVEAEKAEKEESETENTQKEASEDEKIEKTDDEFSEISEM